MYDRERIPADNERYPGRPTKYTGTCKHCGQKFYPGDRCNWNPRVSGTSCHASCYAVYGCPQVETTSTAVPYKVLEAATEQTEVIATTSTSVPVATSGLGETLALAIAPYLEGKLQGLVNRQDVEEIVKDVCEGLTFKRVNVVEVHEQSTDLVHDMGLCHKQFPTLLQAMQARTADGFRLNIWLVGPAGTGKTTAAKKCAEALGLDYYFTGSIDTEYKLMGFVDAQGRCVNTAFRKAYTEGGVFLFDEVDGSLPPALLAFNAALANGECAFPDGVLNRHIDFVCIAAANTWGLGATNDYVGRMKADGAFLDRFVQLVWDTDEDLERATCPNEAWVSKVQTWRRAAKRQGIKVIVSPRASYFGASLLATGLPESVVVEMTVKKAMTADQWNSIN